MRIFYMKIFICFFFAISFVFNFVNQPLLASSENIISDQKSSKNLASKDINNRNSQINELLGPEDTFPFLPDNHRDGSNPIGRIGSISETN